MKNKKVILLVTLAAIAAVVVWYFFFRKSSTTTNVAGASGLAAGRDSRDVAAFNEMVNYFKANNTDGEGALNWMLPFVKAKLEGSEPTDDSYKVNGIVTLTAAFLAVYAASVGKDSAQVTATDRQAFHEHMYGIFYKLRNQMLTQSLTR